MLSKKMAMELLGIPNLFTVLHWFVEYGDVKLGVGGEYADIWDSRKVSIAAKRDDSYCF